MTTAITLWLLGGGAVALYAGWAATAIAGGASPWLYLAGLPLLYLATLCAITLIWFALAWAFRAVRPADRRIGVAATIRLFLDELRAIGRAGPRMALYHHLMPEPAPAPAGAPFCCCTACSATRGRWPVCGAIWSRGTWVRCTRCPMGRRLRR